MYPHTHSNCIVYNSKLHGYNDWESEEPRVALKKGLNGFNHTYCTLDIQCILEIRTTIIANRLLTTERNSCYSMTVRGCRPILSTSVLVTYLLATYI